MRTFRTWPSGPSSSCRLPSALSAKDDRFAITLPRRLGLLKRTRRIELPTPAWENAVLVPVSIPDVSQLHRKRHDRFRDVSRFYADCAENLWHTSWRWGPYSFALKDRRRSCASPQEPQLVTLPLI